jgi:hypothetical protein
MPSDFSLFNRLRPRGSSDEFMVGLVEGKASGKASEANELLAPCLP